MPPDPEKPEIAFASPAVQQQAAELSTRVQGEVYDEIEELVRQYENADPEERARMESVPHYIVVRPTALRRGGTVMVSLKESGEHDGD